jgi:hypothetical protein
VIFFSGKRRSGFLGYTSFRGFYGIQFEGIFFDFFLHVGREVARPFGPFNSRLAIGFAEVTRRIGHDSVAPFAGFHDRKTFSAIIGTAVLLHKNTLCPRFHGLAKHLLNLLFGLFFYSKE